MHKSVEYLWRCTTGFRDGAGNAKTLVARRTDPELTPIQNIALYQQVTQGYEFSDYRLEEISI